MSKKIYYAHSMGIYGSKQESKDIDLLVSLGYDVINPSSTEHAEACKGQMEYFKNVVLSCDLLAFRAHVDDNIGAGVGKEIHWAQEKGMPVFELPTGINRRIISVEQTREYLRELGRRD